MLIMVGLRTRDTVFCFDADCWKGQATRLWSLWSLLLLLFFNQQWQEGFKGQLTRCRAFLPALAMAASNLVDISEGVGMSSLRNLSWSLAKGASAFADSIIRSQ
jgi:hypothetical protein